MRKKCIYSSFGYQIELNERFRLIKQSGFDGVLLSWLDDFLVNSYLNPGEKERQPELALKNGLFIENAHLPLRNTNDLWLENLNGDSFEKLITESIKQCSNYNIPAAVMHLSAGNNPPKANEIGLNRMNRIVDTAEKYNIGISVENVIYNSEHIGYILSKINSPNLGFCYDSGHHNCVKNKSDLLQQYGHRLTALHLHDNDKTGDMHMIPFDGDINWTKTMSQINALNYSGPISIEIVKWKEEAKDIYKDLTAEEFLHRAYKSAVKLHNLNNSNSL